MIQKDDLVRIMNDGEVIEGYVDSTFVVKDITYVQLDNRKVYTMDEVTVVPNAAPREVAAETSSELEGEVVAVDMDDYMESNTFVAAVNEAVMDTLKQQSAKGLVNYGQSLEDADLTEEELEGKALKSAVDLIQYVVALRLKRQGGDK